MRKIGQLYSRFKFISRVDAHLALEFHWSFQKLRANLSALLKSALICSQSFSKATKNGSPSQFSEPIARESQYIHQPIGKKEF